MSNISFLFLLFLICIKEEKNNSRNEIKDLENKLVQLEDRMDEVKNLTNIAAAKSSTVSQEALDLLILDLTLPSIDIEQLQQQVESVSNEVLQ